MTQRVTQVAVETLIQRAPVVRVTQIAVETLIREREVEAITFGGTLTLRLTVAGHAHTASRIDGQITLRAGTTGAARQAHALSGAIGLLATVAGATRQAHVLGGALGIGLATDGALGAGTAFGGTLALAVAATATAEQTYRSPYLVGTSTTSAVSGDATLAVPVGTRAGDLLLAVVTRMTEGTLSHALPAGWLRLGPERRQGYANSAVYWRIVTDDEPASYDLPGGTYRSGVLMAWRGVRAGWPLGVWAQRQAGSASGMAAPDLTVPTDDSRLLYIYGASGSSEASAAWSTPDGTVALATPRGRFDATATAVFDAGQVAAGAATGPSASSTSTHDALAWAITLAPARVPSRAPSLVGVSRATPGDIYGSTDTSVSLPLPAGVAEGDLLVAQVVVAAAAARTVSAPAGWAALDGSQHEGDANVALFTRVAGAGEAGPYTFTWSGASARAAVLVALRGVADDQPADWDVALHTQSDNQLAPPGVSLPVGGGTLLRVLATARTAGGAGLWAAPDDAHVLQTASGFSDTSGQLVYARPLPSGAVASESLASLGTGGAVAWSLAITPPPLPPVELAGRLVLGPRLGAMPAQATALRGRALVLAGLQGDVHQGHALSGRLSLLVGHDGDARVLLPTSLGGTLALGVALVRTAREAHPIRGRLRLALAGREVDIGPGTGLQAGGPADAAAFLASLLPGDTFAVVIPSGGFAGRTALARLLAITLDGQGRAAYRLQIEDHPTAGDALAADTMQVPRYQPPQRASLGRRLGMRS